MNCYELEAHEFLKSLPNSYTHRESVCAYIN